jgi:hypothetical protein
VTKPSILWPLVIIASAGGALLATIYNIGVPMQPAIVFWFMLVCPGMACVRLLEIQERSAELTLAVALSLALDGIVSETMVLARLWSPTWGLAVLAGVSVAGAVRQMRTVTGRAGKPSGIR